MAILSSKSETVLYSTTSDWAPTMLFHFKLFFFWKLSNWQNICGNNAVNICIPLTCVNWLLTVWHACPIHASLLLTYTHTHIYTYTHVHTHIHMYTYTHVHTCTRTLLPDHVKGGCRCGGGPPTSKHVSLTPLGSAFWGAYIELWEHRVGKIPF